MELYLNTANGSYTITDQNGVEYTPEQARELFDSGKLTDYNQAFDRLAHDFDFNINELKEYYRELAEVFERQDFTRHG